MSDHDTWVSRHDSGTCGTRYEVHCSCGFSQAANCHEQADAIARGHCADPTAQVILWDPGPPLTAATITDRDLRDLFARHCECRPLDLSRATDDHAAIHDCDTEILEDVQVALALIRFDDLGRVQAIRDARGRCAEYINNARRSVKSK